MVVARKGFIPQQEFPLIPSFFITPIQLSPAVHSTLELLLVDWDAIFSTFVRMCKCSLVPKPKTTVIGLGVKLITHTHVDQRIIPTLFGYFLACHPYIFFHF